MRTLNHSYSRLLSFSLFWQGTRAVNSRGDATSWDCSKAMGRSFTSCIGSVHQRSQLQQCGFSGNWLNGWSSERASPS
jgi:hypothetical protein